MTGGQGASSGVNLQEKGRELMTALYGALRAIRFYPLENEAVLKALEEVHLSVMDLLDREGAVEFRVVGDFFFLNETRLRLGVRNFATFDAFAQTLRDHGVGEIRAEPGLELREWAPFLSLLLRTPAPSDPFKAFSERLKEMPVERIHVEPEKEAARLDLELEAMAGAKRTYAYAVQITREVLTDVRDGRGVNVRKVKRAVQSIVDQGLADEPSIVAMTTLRELDEYAFTHAVNVCIFSIVMGQRLGLNKLQLYELGLGALFHDVGKTRIDPEVANKTGALTRAEEEVLREHPSEGLLALFRLHGFADVPYRQMLMAYEHHMKEDLTGYPTSRRRREPSFFSQIVAVADAFDTGTSPRSYRYVPRPPDDVLREMRDNPELGFDPVLVKTLVMVTGIYPVGTLLVLDTLELAVVTRANPDPDRLHQPEVKLLGDGEGAPLSEPVTVRLDEIDPATGAPKRTVIKTADPERYGIRVADFVT
jgi:HD-GYP domain-containing protein (c-di-GMP phosphodiesterase class II)